MQKGDVDKPADVQISETMVRDGLTESEARARVERNRVRIAATVLLIREKVARSDRQIAERLGG